ncbi:MAG: hypothetical protein ACFFDK_17195 [Promethearchaeota archaeon]
MKKKHGTCLVCGGNIIYDEESQNFKCFDCDASHSSDLFKTYEKMGKRLHLPRLRILFAILGALYLLFWLYWVLIY